MLTETDRAYLAGFFDGDGCVSIGTRQPPKGAIAPQHYLQVIFAQSGRREWLQNWCDKTGFGSVHHHPRSDEYKTAWTWRIYGQQAETLLRWMLPYLVIKKEQAEIALRFRITKQGMSKRHGTPSSVVELREFYKNTMAALKQECDPGPAPQLEHLLNSQLSFELSGN